MVGIIRKDSLPWSLSQWCFRDRYSGDYLNG